MTVADPRPRPVNPARRFLDALEQFLHIEAASGILLLVATALALAWANSPWAASYEAFWHLPVTLGFGSWVAEQSLHFWINDGLMAVFFLVVGMEIRNELHRGTLSTSRQAALPVLAALGGVLAPAVLYLLINSDDPSVRHGWAVPTATDIAFAVGILTLLGRRVPMQLRVLLLALAIIDDLAAILIIALFYSEGVALTGLLLAAGGVLLTLVFQAAGIRSAWIYVIPALVVWFGMLRSGVHPAIAGVVMGLLTPVENRDRAGLAQARVQAALDQFRDRSDRGEDGDRRLEAPLREMRDAQKDLLPPVVSVQAALHPWVAYLVMPLFALANAGVSFAGVDFGNPALSGIALGIGIGLVVGKPLGIVLAATLGARLGWCEMPPGIGPRALLVLGCLGGIGFTMAVFIADLAFVAPDSLAAAKVAILGASTLAALLAVASARLVLREPPGYKPAQAAS